MECYGDLDNFYQIVYLTTFYFNFDNLEVAH